MQKSNSGKKELEQGGLIWEIKYSVLYSREQQVFSLKGRVVNTLGFSGHVICVTTTQFCHRGAHAATDSK